MIRMTDMASMTDIACITVIAPATNAACMMDMARMKSTTLGKT